MSKPKTLNNPSFSRRTNKWHLSHFENKAPIWFEKKNANPNFPPIILPRGKKWFSAHYAFHDHSGAQLPSCTLEIKGTNLKIAGSPENVREFRSRGIVPLHCSPCIGSYMDTEPWASTKNGKELWFLPRNHVRGRGTEGPRGWGTEGVGELGRTLPVSAYGSALQALIIKEKERERKRS